jgi:tartrate dehydrogenase/decarboxylase/D-malate dehydrogenase
MRVHRIAVIEGDGIGKEVVPAAQRVLDAAAETDGGFRFRWDAFPWGCQYYVSHGRMWEADSLDRLRSYDAILLGAIGDPRVPDHVSLRELLLVIRQRFDQYINLRPMRHLAGTTSPLGAKGDTLDMLCIRENTEGEYCGAGGRFKRGTPDEVALQTAVFTRKGTERAVRYAFQLAKGRPRRLLASATKSNALQHSMVFWDDVCSAVAEDYPDVEFRSYHVDALAARMISHPETLDVIVASNLFGDILTDLGGALQGSLGLAASGNINPERNHPSMFEPVHGSAPDIAGQGKANPVAAIWAGALMLEHLREPSCATHVMRSVERILQRGVRTPDLGGTATTQDVAAAIATDIQDKETH